MDFPVYVASECYGVKLNVALRYKPRYDTLENLFANADNAFALFTIQHVHDGQLLPFAFAYIYNDVLCRWDLLEQEAQLSPCCQVYVFRLSCQESVGAIPEPVNLLLQHVESLPPTGSPMRTQMTPTTAAAHIRSDRWMLPRASREEEFEGNNTPSSTTSSTANASSRPRRRSSNSNVLNQRVVEVPTSSQLPVVNASLPSAASHPAEESTASFRAVPSHRFRLQLMSPLADADLRGGRNAGVAAAVPSSVFKDAARPSSAYRSREGSYVFTSALKPVVPSPLSSPIRSTEVEIPRTWYKSASVAAAIPSSGDRRYVSLNYSALTSRSRYDSLPRYDQDRRYSSASPARSPVSATDVALSRRSFHPQVVLSAALSPPSEPTSSHKDLGPPPLHPSSVSASGRHVRRGSSILREERDRVEARMHMNLTDLRASLQEEDRGYVHTRSSSPQYRR